MDILANFRQYEEKRIERFFSYVERFHSSEIDAVLDVCFKHFVASGYLGRVIVDKLKTKIALATGLEVTRDTTDAIFIASFSRLDEGVKRCLVVTICNDVCKLGVVSEAQVYNFLEDQLSKVPGSNQRPKTPVSPTGRKNNN